ncbi:MAG: GTP-binding protein, partial [Bacteroidales bacterium]|nr:GTP-binding protein [Bacteroidales bacterium]MDD6053133.1 GTP-binding protein [Bacteroidales bacterium]
MKNYTTKEIRNVVLIGSSKSGKTTLSEAMLYEGKVIERRGTVEAGNTVSDNSEFEQTNQKSVYATPLYAEFKDRKFNIIDAPGSDDFSGGALAAFKVCETGILVVNAQQGVEVGTTIFSRYADRYGIPLVVAVNQLDHEKANWEQTKASLKEAYGKKIAFVQFPINPGSDFHSFIDVLTMKYYNFKDDNGTREELEIPAEYAEITEQLHEELMETA